MTPQQRMAKIAARVHNQKTCATCGGTGKVRSTVGKTGPDGKRWGSCLPCVFSSRLTKISSDDMRWLLKRAGYKGK